MNDGGGDGTGGFEVEVGANAAKLADMKVARFRDSINLVTESKMLIEDKAKVSSRVTGVK